MKDYWDALVELVTLPYPRLALHRIAREFSVWSSITAALVGVSLLSVVWAVVPLLSVTPVNGGVIVGLTNISFSTPVYTIKKVAAVSTTSSPSLTTDTSSSTISSTKSSASTQATTTAATPDQNQSLVRVDGSNVPADGRASYRVAVVVKDKNGIVIKDQKPTLVSAQADVNISDSILVGDEWWANVTSSGPGEKAVRVKTGSVELADAKITFWMPSTALVQTKTLVKTTAASKIIANPTAIAALAGAIPILGFVIWLVMKLRRRVINDELQK